MGFWGYVEFHGLKETIVAVDVIENPQGDYYGWLEKDSKTPTMIWPDERCFNMCFPYGPAVEVQRGKGQILRFELRPTLSETEVQQKLNAALRVGGEACCPDCGNQWLDHPWWYGHLVEDHSGFGVPWLQAACDGGLLKL